VHVDVAAVGAKAREVSEHSGRTDVHALDVTLALELTGCDVPPHDALLAYMKGMTPHHANRQPSVNVPGTITSRWLQWVPSHQMERGQKAVPLLKGAPWVLRTPQRAMLPPLYSKRLRQHSKS
jgi:hypothetical protein